jgi:hypothetical protein
MIDLTKALPVPPLDECTALPVKAGDVVIAAPGFEERSRAVFKLLRPTNAARAILLDYRPANPANDVSGYAAALLQLGLLITDEDMLQYSRFTPDDFPLRLRTRLVEVHARSVLVDISSMSRLAIMLVLQVCADLRLRVRVHYAEAATYGPSYDDFMQQKTAGVVRPRLDIYTGVHGCVRVASLSSVAMQGQPTAAIVFMSFDERLTQSLLNTVYPSRLLMINGRPPELRWREIATAWIHEQLRSEWQEDNPAQRVDSDDLPTRVTSTLDYTETFYTLLALYWELHVHHRILLAPTGSKMQTVACYLVKALHRDIHIEYPTPEAFVDQQARSEKDKFLYSEGVGKSWSIDFGELSLLIASTAAAEKRVVLGFV